MFDPDFDSSFLTQKEGRNYVKFYRQWVRNNFKSKEEGREVGEEQDFILIICPGQPKTEVRRKANDSDKMNYATEWMAYEQGKEQRQQGTPIEFLPGLASGRADALKAIYIYTIEQMAGLSDVAIQKVGMGGIKLREQAKAYLANGSAELAETKRQLQEALAIIETLKNTPKKRGPKPKAEVLT